MCSVLVMTCIAISSGMRMAAIEPDAAAVVDGAGVDVGGLPLHGDQQPGHGVDEHHHAAADGQQDEADAHPGGVDPRRPRDRTADAAQHTVVGAAAQGPQLPTDVVVAVVADARDQGPGRRCDQCPFAHCPRPTTVPVGRWPFGHCPFGPADQSPPGGAGAGSGRGPRRVRRAATVGERTRTGIGCLCDTSMIARRDPGGYQGHP